VKTARWDRRVACWATWALAAALILAACSRKEQAEAPAQQTATQTAAAEGKPAVTAKTSAGRALPGAWEADVRNHLLELIAAYGKGGEKYDTGKPPVAVFDFDNTCIRGDIGRAFYDRMVRERRIRFSDDVWKAVPEDKRAALRAAWTELNKLPEDQRDDSTAMKTFRKLAHQAYWSLCHEAPADQCYPWQVRFYAGYQPSTLNRLAYDVINEELKRPLGSEQIKTGPDDPAPAITSSGIRIYDEIRELMFELRRNGFEVYIVTAGPQWVVAGAARHFAVASEYVIGMRTKIKDGKLTSEIDPPPTFKEGKVQAIQKYIGVQPVLVLGDSWTDADMLSYAKHAVLIDRGYADLKERAVQAGWWIQPPFPVK